ncbi:MAG: CHASE2 domain-containing protein [Phormidesmis sp.]
MIPIVRRLKGLNRMMPGLIIGVGVVVLMQLQAWAPLERIVDSHLIRWRGATIWDSRIVMISIDDKTLSQLGQFPISRSYYAELIWLLEQEETSVVVFNMLFSDDGVAERDLMASSAANAQLANAMATHGRVVIGETWNDKGNLIKPVPVLAKTAISMGHLRLNIDRDLLTRSLEMSRQGVPALSVAAIQAYGLESEIIKIPTELTTLKINWPGPAADLATLSFIDVLNGQVPAGYLKGKIVIVGYGATTGQAPLRTPFDNQVPVQGGYMHAAVIDNLLGQNWLRSIPESATLLLLLVGGPLFSGWLRQRRTLVQVVISAGMVAGWLLISMVALEFDYLLLVVPPLMMLSLVGMAVTILGWLQSNALLQVRSAFLSTMSHEIRTPLNAIVNLSELLQETPLDDRQREFVDTLNNSSQTLLALINDVLDFSKIESGRFMLEAYPIRLADLLERSIEILAPRAAGKGLELVYAITPDTPPVIMGDPVRLKQILLNLLSNAVKFTEQGEVSVLVQSRVVSERPSLFLLGRQRLLNRILDPPLRLRPWWQRPSGDMALSAAAYDSGDQYEIRFAIRDTGIGISPEQVRMLFKPFSQVSASTVRKYGGTGLGLSISKRLSERMGGDLWVRSYPGEGSTFWFTLRSRLADAPQVLPDYLAGLKGSRLLLVDRNATRRDHFVWTLQPLGISLAQATSFSEAMSFMRSDPTFDGIILDEAVVVTPDERDRVVAKLREQSGQRALPIILLSSLKSSTGGAQLETFSDTTVLWKPVKRASLYQALQAIRPLALVPLAEAVETTGDRRSPPALVSVPNEPLPPAPVNISINILIAEDNLINQRVALRLLELLGYRADVVASGKAVLAAVRRQHYEVILMDMRMPELDGVEATRQLRQMPQHQDTWIIAMTANAMTKDRQRCFAAGMDDYLSKPINRAALAQALQRCPAVQRVS